MREIAHTAVAWLSSALAWRTRVLVIQVGPCGYLHYPRVTRVPGCPGFLCSYLSCRSHVRTASVATRSTSSGAVKIADALKDGTEPCRKWQHSKSKEA